MLYRFGPFELDSRTSELRRDGELLPLQPQPAAILALLVRRAGELVTREEIQQAIWPDRTVDFEQGLNDAIRQIRSALADSAATPSYVETLPRRGYRFVAPVERHEPGHRRPRTRTWALAAAAAGLVLAVTAADAVARFAGGADEPAAGALPADPATREAYLVAGELVETRDMKARRGDAESMPRAWTRNIGNRVPSRLVTNTWRVTKSSGS